TQAAIDFANVVALTSQAQADRAAATQQALELEQQLTAQATLTQGMATIIATQTQGAAAYWQHVTATQLVATQQIERSKVQAAQMRVWIWNIALVVVLGLIIAYFGSKVWRSWKLSQAEFFQATALPPDQHGRLPVVTTQALGRNNKLVNPNLAHRAVIDPEHDDLTTEQALANTQLHVGLEATRAIAQSPLLKRLLGKPAVSTETPMPNANVDIAAPMLNLLAEGNGAPAWSLMENWDGQGDIPFGVSARGLDRLSLAQTPHGGIFGQTGKGKSRYFLRPFIAAAIASGQRVVILGKQADFWPFEAHPNVKMVPVRHITQPEEAARYAGYLKRIVEEMNRRDDYLTSSHRSTWDRAGRENTVVILDELGNALDMMPRDVAQDAYRWVQ
ncbi:MAG: hypothetical protein ACRETN_05555, partial [Nevskiales bacterium]